MSLIIKIVVVLVVLAGGTWLVMYSGVLNKPKPVTTTEQTATTTASVPEPEQNMNGMSVATDTTDEALLQDTTALDIQMQGLATDAASIDVSLNDKPGTQAY